MSDTRLGLPASMMSVEDKLAALCKVSEVALSRPTPNIIALKWSKADHGVDITGTVDADVERAAISSLVDSAYAALRKADT